MSLKNKPIFGLKVAQSRGTVFFVSQIRQGVNSGKEENLVGNAGIQYGFDRMYYICGIRIANGISH
jgi:hypothetical protein